ncbi:MAG: LolA family protein [Ignavibacteriales bacterium]
MKYLRILIAALSLMIILSACGNRLTADNFQNIQKKLFELRSYQCTAKIVIYNNKNSTKYLVRQIYLQPSRFRTEVIQPEFMKGILTISNGSQTKVRNPNLNMNNTYISENLIKLTGNNMLLTYFFSNYVGSEKSTMDISNGVYRLKAYIPDETDYMETEILSINKDGSPDKLEIFDKQGNLKIEIKFIEFALNPKFDDSIFE